MKGIGTTLTLLAVTLLATVIVLTGCGKGPEQAPAPTQPAHDATEPAEHHEHGAHEHDVSAAPAETPSPAIADVAGAKPQTLCPVMGNPIKKNFYVDHEGRRIFFCCPECLPIFRKDPEKYMSKMKAEGIQLQKSPE